MRLSYWLEPCRQVLYNRPPRIKLHYLQILMLSLAKDVKQHLFENKLLVMNVTALIRFSNTLFFLNRSTQMTVARRQHAALPSST